MNENLRWISGLNQTQEKGSSHQNVTKTISDIKHLTSAVLVLQWIIWIANLHCNNITDTNLATSNFV